MTRTDLPAGLGASTRRGELAATVALALPLAGANLIQMMVYAVDVIFVARLGPLALAASSLGVSIFGLLMWSSTGLVGAAAPLISAELGRRRHAVREVRRTFRMALWLALLSGVIVAALCLGGEAFMRATGQDPEVTRQAGAFLAVLALAALPNVMAWLLRTFVSAMGRAGIATAVTLLALAVNSLGNYAFVFGHFGAPALGLVGSAISSVITACAMMLAYMAIIFSDRRFRRYRLFGRFWRSDWPRFFDLVRIGLPITGTILAEAGLFSGAAFLMGRLGEAELAGHTLVLQLAALAFQVPYGIGQAATIRVGYHYGAGDRAGMGHAGNAGIALGIGFMALTGLVMALFPRTILRLYIDPDAAQNAALVGFALQYIVVAAAFQLFDGAQAVTAGALRGLQDTRVPMAIAIFGYWLPGFGTAILLGFLTALAGTGIWLGLMAGLVVVSILLGWRWLARDRLGLTAVHPAG
ncbi:MATE family efflux transporter [Parablastomonas sp. CN1-191]|uniref:MATE family efflux transporter n=1 Tax=Parablastomonas sp. CN1-191 TaxID=3400908 RepID=UPI003BF8BF4B